MKALILKEYGHLVYGEAPDPTIGKDDLLVRIKACAICGSDVHGLDGSTGRRIPPIIMGHEASGVVEAVGENVTGFAPGDRITFDSTIYCGRCAYCRRGRVNLCDYRRVLGVSCGDYRQHGALAEFVVVPQHIAVHLPEAISFEDAAMVEPVAIALHAVNRSAISLNDTAAVIGTGTIGLFVVQLLRLAGCGRIVAVDKDRCRLKMAHDFGSDEEVHISTDAAGATQLLSKLGADVAFEVVGISETLQMALASLRKAGTLTLVGNLSPRVDLPLQMAVTREITVNGSCASAGEYETCLDLIARDKLDVKSMVSAVAPLAEGASWFGRLYKGEPGLMKVVLVP